MFVAPQAASPVSALSIVLADAAEKGQLVLCVGAGLSMAADASLPSGASLAELLNARLLGLIGYQPPDDTADLIAVADAAEGPRGGREALQFEVLKLAEFTRAVPNYGHQVVALLLAEGAITVLSWNWDTCIERSRPEREDLQVAKTDTDMSRLTSPQLAKVHGCATMPRSLLITSEQLQVPPPWANDALAERLRSSAVVFIGIGDVADYAKRRITELFDALVDLDVRVVSPTIRSAWDQSVWKIVVPELADPDDDRRFELYADDFLDDLARGWVRDLLNEANAKQSSLRPEVADALQAVVSALGARSAVELIAWCRSAAAKPVAGTSLVRSSGVLNAIVAAAALAAESGGPVAVPRRACCRVGDVTTEVLIVDDLTPADEVRREAERRISVLATNDQIHGGGDVRFLVVGSTIGDLTDPLDIGPGLGTTDDVMDGPLTHRPTFIPAAPLIAMAA